MWSFNLLEYKDDCPIHRLNFPTKKWYRRYVRTMYRRISAHGRSSSIELVSLDDWIAREATPFSVDSPRTFKAAVDKVIASLGDSSEESDLLRTHPSKLHRFRLAGCPRFNRIGSQLPVTATVKHNPK